MKVADQAIENVIQKIDFENIGKHPNILIAARFWDDDRYLAALTCYKLMRRIDDLIDDSRASEEVFSCLKKQWLTGKVYDWIDCIQAVHPDEPFFQSIGKLVRKFHIPSDYFHRFADSMVYDIHHNGFETMDDFLEYAEGASNCPASIFVHLCCLQSANGLYRLPPFDIAGIARPCAMFSYLVHIIRDFRKDQSENLNYFASDILEKHGLSYPDLKEIATGQEIPVGFRALIREYKDLADRYRKQTVRMLEWLEGKIEPRYLSSLHVIYDLYLQVFERIDPEAGSFTADELIPKPSELKERLLKMAFTTHPGLLVG